MENVKATNEQFNQFLIEWEKRKVCFIGLAGQLRQK